MTATVPDPTPSRAVPRAGTARERRRGDALAESGLMVGRAGRLALRDPDSMIMAVVLPVMLMLLFVYVFGGAIDVAGEYVDYVAPGIILLCAGFGASGTTVAVASDVTGGMMDRFRSMPIAAATVLSGHVVVSGLRNLATTVIVFSVALLLGFRPDAGALDWLGAVGLILLYVLAITWVATFVGVVVRSVEAAAGFTFFILFVPYVSSAFVDPDTMPGWLRGFAVHQPVTPVTDTIRDLLTGSGRSSPLEAVVWCVGITLVFTVAASWAFARRSRR